LRLFSGTCRSVCAGSRASFIASQPIGDKAPRMTLRASTFRSPIFSEHTQSYRALILPALGSRLYRNLSGGTPSKFYLAGFPFKFSAFIPSSFVPGNNGAFITPLRITSLSAFYSSLSHLSATPSHPALPHHSGPPESTHEPCHACDERSSYSSLLGYLVTSEPMEDRGGGMAGSSHRHSEHQSIFAS